VVPEAQIAAADAVFGGDPAQALEVTEFGIGLGQGQGQGLLPGRGDVVGRLGEEEDLGDAQSEPLRRG
jgi:hypothetical protein